MQANTLFTELIDRTEQQDYRDHVIVEGGFQDLLERDVVIRRLRGEAAAHPRVRSRFVSEVKFLAMLSHHAFIRVYDARIHDELPFAVFERLRGVTVQHRLDLLAEQEERMSLDEVTHIVQNVADGLEYAQGRGVRVYDLTPGNIVLAEGRRVVLTGLGQPLPDNPLQASVAALVYASPEQLFGLPYEGVSTVYSLGVLLAHLVCGRLPFEGNALSVLAQKQRASSLPVLEDVRTSLMCPYPLAAVIHRATLANPAERYESIRSFRAALRESLTDRRTRAPFGPHQGVSTLSLPEAPGSCTEAFVTQAHAGAVEQPTVRQPAIPSYPAGESVRLAPETLSTAEVGRALEQAQVQPAATLTAEVTRALEQAQVQPAATFAVEEERVAPATVAPEATPIPGADKPELQAALPYTLLVPLPEEQPDVIRMAPERSSPGLTLISPVHLVTLLILGALAIGAALLFG
ncbi:MAG: protein kinase [Chloroflexaceae bacterium]